VFAGEMYVCIESFDIAVVMNQVFDDPCVLI
jgi:hypothetical protein